MSEEKKASSTVLWTFIGTLITALVACVGSITAAGITVVPDMLKELSSLKYRKREM